MRKPDTIKLERAAKGNKVDSWLFATVRMMDVLSNIDAFLEWIDSSKKHKKRDAYLPGYRMVVGLSFGVVIDRLCSSYLLDLEHDFRLYRLNFSGKNLADLPNYSESIVILKRFKEINDNIFKAKTWEDLRRRTIEGRDLIDPLVNYFKEAVGTRLLDEKNIVLDRVTLDLMHYFFDVEASGMPMFWVHNVGGKLDSYKDGDRVIPGYVMAFEFIVMGLDLRLPIGKRYADMEKQLAKYRLKSEQFVDDEDKHPFERFGECFVDPNLHIIRSEEEADRADEENRVRWSAVHFLIRSKWKNYSRLFKGAVTQKDHENYFYIINPKSKLKLIIKKADVREPNYFSKTDYASIKKQLDYHLYWYDFSLVDSCGYGGFNGVPAFISILFGYCKLREINGVDKPVVVRVFKHPELTDGQFRYSFGVLVEMIGSFTDGSGWLIFNDCATDFSGTGSLRLHEANSVIEALVFKGQVEAESLEVDQNNFNRYLAENKFEIRVAEESQLFHIDSTKGIIQPPQKASVNTTSEINAIIEVNRSIEEAFTIIDRVKKINITLSEITRSNYQMITISPELALLLIKKCESIDDLTKRVCYLYNSFTGSPLPFASMLSDPDPNSGGVAMLRKWNREMNNSNIPDSALEVWINIIRLRSNTWIHEPKNESIQLARYFGSTHPVDYGILWQNIVDRFSKSLDEFLLGKPTL